MANRIFGLVVTLIFAAMPIAALSSATHAQNAQQAPSTAAPARDPSGVWTLKVNQDVNLDDRESPGGTIPPMTAWANALYDAEKPGSGRKAAPGGNDPILQCDPVGFPRILFFPTPFEFIPIPGRILQAFERDHIVRVIWMDGRPLPKDAADTPLWYGYSVGKWEDDYTLVVETAGLDDRTWLGASGYPHSTSMVVEERYRRVDHDTIQYSLTMTDPVAYTRPWIGATKTMKLNPQTEISQSFCVHTEQNRSAQKIRAPAK